MSNRFRPWIAALLALAIVGLGHAYLRRWGRALVWLITVLASSFLLHALNDVEPVNPITNPEGIPMDVLLPVTLLIVLSAIDAFLLGREDLRQARTQKTAVTASNGGASGVNTADGNQEGLTSEIAQKVPQQVAGDDTHEGTPMVKCPHCGKETDADIDFCHWCTEPLPELERRDE